MNNSTDIVIVKDNLFKIIHTVVNEMTDLIRPTFGPAGNKVIISKILNHETIDDGAKILAQYEDPDPVKNAIVKEVRQVSGKTNDRVGDGTTGAVLMILGIVSEAARLIRIDGRKIEIELKRGLDEFTKKLQKSARQIKTKEDLKKVALTAFNNEPIAEMLADLYYKIGKDGIVTIGSSSTMETFVEMTDGTKLEAGYISPYMINNPERMETVLEKPYILITDYRLTEDTDLMPIMEKMREAGAKNLVIFAENVEANALATLVVNLPNVINPQTRTRGIFPSIAVGLPKVADRNVLLEDIAILTGAKVFSIAKGDKLETIEVSDLGRADQFICRKNESIIVGPKGKKDDVKNAVIALKLAIENETKEKEKHDLTYRLGRFTNTIAVIKVGAMTDSEKKSLREKLDDAIHSVKSAYKNGVVCGAGLALARIKTSSPLLNEALKYPSRQLRENMGLDNDNSLAVDEVENLVTGKIGKFMDVGVMDPVDVLIAGVESAVSIASTLLTSSGMISESPRKPPIASV